MKTMTIGLPRRIAAALLFATAFCIVGSGMLTTNAQPAHALFTSEVRLSTARAVEAFPMTLAVDADGYRARSEEIDRDQLKVTLIFSDGTSRVLDADEYELSPSAIPSGHKGPFRTEATYDDDGRKLTAPIDLDVDEAYGAQYGGQLVFGRGIPEQTYGGVALASTTWGIEEEDCTPLWNKGTLTDVLDMETVRPQSVSGWFNGSATLRSVVLDQMDTTGVTSLYAAFNQDTALVEVDLSGWDTSNVTSMEYMFQQCSSLTRLDLSTFDMSSVTTIGDMFRAATSLTAIDGLSDWDTGNVESMREAFAFCMALGPIDISRWNVAKVRSFTGMFCMYATWQSSVRPKLTSVGDLSGWDLSSAQSIGSMFQFNDAIRNTGNIGKWNVSTVTNCANIFQGCTALVSVGDLSSWKVGNVTNMHEMFQGCTALTTIGNVSKWDTSKVQNMYQMFQGDTKLSVDCSAWNVNSVTDHTRFNTDGATKVIAPSWKS